MYERGVKKENKERCNNTACVNLIQVNVSEGRVQPISGAVTKPPAVSGGRNHVLQMDVAGS